jgi:hypothetical protein
MSGQVQTDQVEAQAAQVEQEFRREEIRESKAMDSKLLAPKRVSAQAFSKAIDDDKRSVASGQSAKPLSPALFFESSTAKSAAEIGEAAGTGDFPGLDKSWEFWLAPSHPNSVKLSEHEKANVEELCIVARHQAAAVQKLEELMEQLEGVESDDAKDVADSVGTALQFLDVAVVHNKNMLDDYGQKWFHTLEQFETNRLFARARNPELESIAAGPGIFNVFKRQVNAYGQLAAYKSACSKLVPKAVAPPKTDWRAGSAASKAKPRKQQAPQQMAAAASARPQAGRGHGGAPRPPATAPVAAVAIVP